MSRDLQALAEGFERVCALNREALAALRGQSPLSQLYGLFERKRQAMDSLLGAQEALSVQTLGPQGAAEVERILQIQRQAALLETQVAEALGNAVPRNGNAIAAYQKTSFGGRKVGLDQSL